MARSHQLMTRPLSSAVGRLQRRLLQRPLMRPLPLLRSGMNRWKLQPPDLPPLGDEEAFIRVLADEGVTLIRVRRRQIVTRVTTEMSVAPLTCMSLWNGGDGQAPFVNGDRPSCARAWLCLE